MEIDKELIAKREASNGMEDALLGGMMRWPSSIADVVLVITPEDFRQDYSQRIYSALIEMYTDNKPIDGAALADLLYVRGDIEKIGGYGTIGKILDSAGTNLAYYAKSIKEAALCRRLAVFASTLLDDALRGRSPGSELAEQAESALFAITERSASEAPYTLSEVLASSSARIDARLARKGEMTGVPSGLKDLDDITNGFQPGELVLIAARPSVGKTAVGLSVLRDAVLNDKVSVLFVSIEQGRDELGERLLCSYSQVDGERVRKGRMTDEEISRISEANRRLQSKRTFVDDSSRQTIARIAGNARRIKRRSGLDMIVVDYLQLITPDNPRDPQHERLAKTSWLMKQLAREMKVPIVSLAQLNREVEGRSDGRPKLSDLRGSGDLEQNADTVILLHRPKDTPNLLELIVEKQRNGPLGSAIVSYDRTTQRLSNYTFQTPMDTTGEPPP